MLFVLALGAGLGGLIAGSCTSYKSQEKKNPSNGNANFIPPHSSIQYPLKVQDSDLSILHQDLNEDGLVQVESEPLFLKVGDHYIRSGHFDFEKYRKQFRLPTFQGLAIGSWYRIHQEIFPKEAYPIKKVDFLQEYSSSHGFDLSKAWQMARRWPHPLPKRSDALTASASSRDSKRERFRFLFGTRSIRSLVKQGFHPCLRNQDQ
jgi:hypothetical protein